MTARTLTELRVLFWQQLRDHAPDLAKYYKPRLRQNDYPADIRVAWCDFVDGEHRRDNITDALARRATL